MNFYWIPMSSRFATCVRFFRNFQKYFRTFSEMLSKHRPSASNSFWTHFDVKLEFPRSVRRCQPVIIPKSNSFLILKILRIIRTETFVFGMQLLFRCHWKSAFKFNTKGKSHDKLKAQGRISKKIVSKSFVHVLKYASFQLYRAYSDKVIWKNWHLTTIM